MRMFKLGERFYLLLEAVHLHWKETKKLKSVLSHPFRTVIHMYTVEAVLYKVLNKAMRENIEADIELYRDYIFYLHQAWYPLESPSVLSVILSLCESVSL